MNIEQLANELLENFQKSAGAQWDAVKDQAHGYGDIFKGRMRIVAQAQMFHPIDPAFLQARAEDEVSILKSQAIALGISAAVFTQHTVNSAYQGILLLIIDLLQENNREAKHQDY